MTTYVSDSIHAKPADAGVADQPKDTAGRMFRIAIALYLVGMVALLCGAHFDNHLLVTASLVPLVSAVSILIAYHGRLH